MKTAMTQRRKVLIINIFFLSGFAALRCKMTFDTTSRGRSILNLSVFGKYIQRKPITHHQFVGMILTFISPAMSSAVVSVLRSGFSEPSAPL